MLPVIVLSAPWRAVTAALVALSVVTLPTYFAALFLLPPIPLVVTIRSFVLGTALPAATAWGIARLFSGTAGVDGAALRVRRADLEIDAPCASVGGVRPWWLPLPRPGLTVRLGGAGPSLRVACDDAAALVQALGGCGVDVAAAAAHPTVVWAATRRRRRWWSALVKFPVAGTAPACLFFYTHQHIAYGGTFGQWNLEGLPAYLATLWQYWATTIVLLVSYASSWRLVGEIVVWTSALAGRGAAGVVRRVVEVACALAYWAGVPALLALRYSA